MLEMSGAAQGVSRQRIQRQKCGQNGVSENDGGGQGRGVRRIIVYRLDRISRSVLGFANVIGELLKLSVEFVSITKYFDMSTPIGKTMLMIVTVFSQLERETTQQRKTPCLHKAQISIG